MARVLVVRPKEQGEATAKALRQRGHEPVLLPLQEIAVIDGPPPEGPFAAILATSANAVPALARHFGKEAPVVLAVGAATEAALRREGFSHVEIGEGTGESLAGRAAALSQAASGRPVLYATGRPRTDGLENALSRSRTLFSLWEVYETRDRLPNHGAVEAVLRGRPVDAVLLLSVGQAEAYAAALGREILRFDPAPVLLCLSERIRDALPLELAKNARVSTAPALSSLFERLS